MNYSQDFPPAADVYSPLPDQLALGLPPLLLGLMILVLLAAGLAGWVLGHRRQTPGSSDGAAIWKAIDDDIRAAMTAHSDGLRDKATALSRTVEARLGRTLALTGGLKAFSALKTALKDPEPAAHASDHGVSNAAAPSHDADHATNKHDTELHLAAVVIERASQVVIHSPPPPTGAASGGHEPPKPPTEAEQRDAIRKALSELNDWWRLKDARIAEIEAVHRELSAKT
jgi:hypothetical protein